MYPKIFKKRSIIKRPVIISGINNNRNRMRQRLIQHLQILVLILIFLILSMRLWIQIIPDWNPWNSDLQCDTCVKTQKTSSVELSMKKYKTLNDYNDEIEEVEYNRYYNDKYKHKQYIDNDIDIDETFGDNNYVKGSGDDDDDRQQPKDFYIPPFQHNNDNNHQESLSSSSYDYDFTVVTGASRNHFCPLKSFLYKINTELHDYRINLIVYDLGISKKQTAELYQLKEQGFLTTLRKFNYSYYPSFFDIKKSKGEYSWKPAIIAELAHEYPGTTLTWLDSGTSITKLYFRRLKNLLKYHKGFLSPRSAGFMGTWTHPGVYKFYNDEINRRKYNNVPNCNGASMSFDTSKTKKLIDDWYRCALVKDCIAPKGSSRINHRQDQAIITYLAAKEKLFCNDRKLDYGITTHQDKFCKKYNEKFEINLKL